MKKVSLLLMSLIGATALVACNSGGGSSGGGGGGGGCANGATSCGASAAATQYNEAFPSPAAGNLITTTNVVIGNGDTAAVTFTVQNITAPVTVSFAVSGGNLQSNPSYTFTDNNSSYTVVLQPTGNSATITPSVGASNMTAVTINTIASSTVYMPLGTYSLYGNGVNSDCSVEPGFVYDGTVVFTQNETFHCDNVEKTCSYAGDGSSSPITLPSYGPNGGGDMIINAGWLNNKLMFTDTWGFTSKCQGMSFNEVWTRTSGSTSLPYPVVDASTLKTQNMATKLPSFRLNLSK